MLVNGDVKGLEVVVAAELSGDKVLCQEIIDGEDIHGNNQKAFKLPSRLIAKTFKFRLIYGGSAYSYAHDSDFMGVSSSEKFWQKVIDAYYEKYSGIKGWHESLIRTVIETGRIEIPSGRHYPIQPTPGWNGGLKWPLTIIKNYPVQGFGADLVMLARLETRKRLRAAGVKCDLISTIHDSVVADTPKENVEIVGKIIFDSIQAVPKLCKQVWDYDFYLPLTSEIQYGPNKKDMVDLVL